MMLAALAVVLVPYALWTVWRSQTGGEGPWLTSLSTLRSSPPRARTIAAMSLARIGVYAFLTVFALIYLLPLVVVVANSFRDLPEITHNGLIAMPRSFSLKAWPHGVGALLRRRHLRRHPAQFLQFAADDDSGDDHLDAARRDQRLCAVEVALSGIGDAVRLHDARRVHAGPDRAAALGLSSSARCGLSNSDLWPRFSSTCVQGLSASRRCSAATITSTFPTI